MSMGTLLAFAIVCAGVLILRRIEPDTPRPFRTPGMPWVPVFGTLICLYLMSGLAPSDVDQVVRLARDWAHDLLHLRTISGGGCARSAHGECRLNLSSGCCRNR